LNLLLAIALAAVSWAVVAAMLVVGDRRRRGLSVNVPLLRLYIIPYLSEYRRLTRIETGHTGPLFWHYVVPINLALLLAIVALLRR
jgi:hypothetical protein